MVDVLKELTSPWGKTDIKWRVGSVNKEKTKALPLAYIDARTVMERLDSAVGAANWQDKYEFHGSRTICYLSIKIGDEWITKADGAGNSDVEADKGAISDAFKRAAVKWGMGRELYELKCNWMPIDKWKKLIGNPWKYVRKSDDDPVSDISHECEEYLKDLQSCASKELLSKFWSDPDSKNRRGKIKFLNEEEYSKIYDAMQDKLDSYNG